MSNVIPIFSEDIARRLSYHIIDTLRYSGLMSDILFEPEDEVWDYLKIPHEQEEGVTHVSILLMQAIQKYHLCPYAKGEV
jgi:hypothetical protein